MVTKYSIPCSVCGKSVPRFVFCSGACKVMGHRERLKLKVTEDSILKPLVTKTEEIPKVVKPKVTMKITPPIRIKKYSKMLNKYV